MRTNVAAVPATTLNHEGTRVLAISPFLELRRLVMSLMLFEKNFYGTGEAIAARIKELVPIVGFTQVAALAVEARNGMKLRHAPLFLARELARKSPGRAMGDLLVEIIQRPDEITEFLAIYWRDGHVPISRQVKVGLARALRRFGEHQLSKYNGGDGAVRLRDVLFLVHAMPADAKGDGNVIAAIETEKYSRGEVHRHRESILSRLVADTLAPAETWESMLSGGADKKAAFTHLILDKKLGALAMIRNLRKMLEVGVDHELIRQGLGEMNTERVLPFQFITAARHAPMFEPQLEAAMFRCLEGATRFAGRTALVVDASPSMWQDKISEKSEMTRFDAAAALAILVREICDEVRVYAFNTDGFEVPPRRGFALAEALGKNRRDASCGGSAVALANRDGYDRIIVITDGQWHYLAPGSTSRYMSGKAEDVSPPPLTSKAFMVNIAATRCGVGYGKWHSIDGWSEAVLEYVQAVELDRP